MGLNMHQAKQPRNRWIWLGMLAGLLLAVPSAHAQDPVEKLRQALLLNTGDGDPKVEILVKRRKQIEASVAELNSISQLRRAYNLKEWMTHIEVEKVDPKLTIDRYRIEIGDRLIKTVNLGAEDPDPNVKIPIASLIAEMSDADQATERRGQGKFTRAFTKTISNMAKDENLLVRQYALSALGKITPKPGDVVPLLRSALKSDALGPRRFAAFALNDLVKNASSLRIMDDDKKRPEDNEELQTIHQVIAAAADGFNDDDERVRGYCLQAILESAKALTDYIGSSSQPILREEKGNRILDRDLNAVLNSLQAVNPSVLARVKDAKINVRLTALHAMDQIGVARGKLIQTLHELTTEKNTNNSELLKAANATDPLGNLIQGDWKHVVALLKDDETRIRRGAMEILEQLGEQGEVASDEVTRALSDPDRWVRWTAARALRHYGHKKISSAAIRALGAMLSDPDADLSAAAADALGEMGPNATEAVEALVINVGDGDVENRIKAMNALVRIGGIAGGRATPKLVETLSDSDVRIRRAAAETLGQFGPAAKAALPALRAAMRDIDGAVRLNASEAILSIAPPQKKL